MVEFRYKAVGRDGEFHRGTQDAVDEDEIVKWLHEKNLVPFEITAQTSFLSFLGDLFRSALAKPTLTDENALFLARELASLLEAGIEADNCLELLSELVENPVQQRMINRILTSVRAGGSLSAAIEQEEGAFKHYFAAMAQAGEISGKLALMLRAVARFIGQVRETREAIKSALLYPCVLLFVTMGSIIFLVSYVFPRFRTLFETTGAEPPAFTAAVFTIGEMIASYWWEGLFVILLALLIANQMSRSQTGRQKLHSWILRWPLVGSMVVKLETARHARALASSLNGGVPLVTGLNAIVGVVSNADLRSRADRLDQHVREGKSLSKAIEEEGLYPTAGLQAVKIGEATGGLGAMLERVADLYERETTLQLKRYLALMTPILTIVSGLIIGGLIATIMLTVLSVNELPL